MKRMYVKTGYTKGGLSPDGIVPIFNITEYIRTSVFSPLKKSNLMPLLLVHGFASGSALWCKNIDALAKSRAVYVFDLLGFGRSSRPDFILDDIEVEDYLIQSIEEWRQAMKLERFILLGHSLGGYLSTSYALRHADKYSVQYMRMKIQEEENQICRQVWRQPLDLLQMNQYKTLMREIRLG